jgi:hypothetical protein
MSLLHHRDFIQLKTAGFPAKTYVQISQEVSIHKNRFSLISEAGYTNGKKVFLPYPQLFRCEESANRIPNHTNSDPVTFCMNDMKFCSFQMNYFSFQLQTFLI